MWVGNMQVPVEGMTLAGGRRRQRPKDTDSAELPRRRFGPVYDSATLSSTNSCRAGDGGYRRPVRVRDVDLTGKQPTAICDSEHAYPRKPLN